MSLQFESPLEILLSIDKVFYHDIQNNVKDLVQSGTLILYTGKIKGREILSIRIGHFVMNLIEQLVILKCQYQSAVIYYLVVPTQDLVSSITFDKNHQQRPKFENYLRTHCKTIEREDLDYHKEISDTIEKHWSGFLLNPVCIPDKVQQLISSAGTGMEKQFIKLSNKIRNYYENYNKKQEAPNPRNIEVEPQVQIQYTQHVGEVIEDAAPQPAAEPQLETSKFKKFLSVMNTGFQKASNVFSKVSTPIVKKGRQLNNKVCYKIDKSESKVLKYMKDFAAVTNDALSNAYSGIRTGVTNKQVLYVTHFCKDAVIIDNPQLSQNNQGYNTQQPTPMNITGKGLNDGLLNKSQYQQNIETPYEERI